MNRAKHVAKRGLSMLLTLAMLLSVVNISVFAEEASSKTVLKSDLLLDTYGSNLSSAEKAVVKALVDGSYTYTAPDALNESGLITVDEAGQTIEAKTYKDGEGNSWLPAKAEISVEGEEPVALALTKGEGDVYTGAYTADKSKPYAVNVTYTYTEDVSDVAAAWATALKTPAQLARGCRTLASMKDGVVGKLDTLASGIDTLYEAVTDGLGFPGLSGRMVYSDEQFKAAVTKLYDQAKNNGTGEELGKFDLSVLYGNDGASVALLLDKGAELAAKNAETLEIVTSLYNSDGWRNIKSDVAWAAERADEAKEKANQLKNLDEILEELIGNMGQIKETKWLPDEDVKALAAGKDLDTLVAAITEYDATRTYTVENTLTVAEQKVTVNVGQRTVTVVLTATVVDRNNENRTLTAQAFELVRPVGTTKADIEAAVAASGMEAKALADWDEDYQVNETNYTRKADGLPAELGDDNVTYTITYTPNTVAFKTTQDGKLVDSGEHPYGYTLELPKHEDSSKAYDYVIDGKRYFEGDTYRLTQDVTIERSEGKAYTAYEIDELAAQAVNTGLSDDAKAVLTNAALNAKKIQLRKPGNDDGLVDVVYHDGAYTVTAQTYNAAIADQLWVPVKAAALGEENAELQTAAFTENEGVYTAALTESNINRILVTYQLSVPAEVVEAETFAVVNLPATLAKEYAAQKDGLAKLLDTQVKDDMSKLDQERLNKLWTVADTKTNREKLSEEAYLGIKDVKDNCVENGNLILANYMNAYAGENGGMTYYYINSDDINEQIKRLADDLVPVIEDAAFKQLLDDNGYGDYYGRIKNIVDAVTYAQEKLDANRVNEAIATTSGALGDLLGLLETGTINEVAAPAVLELNEELEANVPGRNTLTIVVESKYSDGKLADSKSDSITIGEEETIDPDDLDSKIEAMKTALYKYDAALYEVKEEDARPTTLTANTTYTVTISPKQFKVTAVEGEETIELGEVAFDHLTIDLPTAPEGSGNRYYYYFNNEPVKGNNYPFGVDDLKNNKLSFKRETVNETRKATIDLVDKLNEAIVTGGMTASVNGGETGVATFLLREAENGKKALVLRLTPSKNLNYGTLVAKVGETVAGSDLEIKINGEKFWTNHELTVQTAMNLALNSGFGMQAFTKTVNADGSINELTDAEILAGLTAEGTQNASRQARAMAAGPRRAPAAESTELLNTYVVYQDILNGGTLVKAEIELNGEVLDFYITMEDFGVRQETLKTLRENIQKLTPYFDITMTNDSVQLTVKDGPAYKAYLSAAVAAGYANVNDLYNMDDQEFIEFLFGFVDELVKDENIKFSTYENTLAALEVDVDVSRFSSYYDRARKGAKELITKSTLNSDKSSGTYWSFNYGIERLLEKAIEKDARAEQLKDYIVEASVDYALSVVLPDTEYVAIVINPDASNRNKISYPSDVAGLQATINEDGNNTAVILLTDVTGTVEINKNVVLDLNGKTLDGLKVGAAANHVVVVDSTLDNTGSITAVEGTDALKITGGTFPENVEAYLPNDYVQENGKVHNKLYDISLNAAGDEVTVTLNADRISLYGFPSPKALAVELAFDLAINYYSAAAVKVDGNELYNVTLTDVGTWLVNVTEEDAAEAIDSLNVPNINTFANQVIADLTDFGAMKTAVEGGTALAEYSYETQAWTLTVGKHDSKDRLAVGIEANDGNPTGGKLVIKVDGTDDAKTEVAELLGKLDEVTETLNVSVELKDNISYHARTLTVEGTAEGEVVINLSEDPNYAVALGVILAAGVEDNSELIEAIKTYHETEKLGDLKAAMENLTNTQVLEALAKLNRSAGPDIFAGLVEQLGLTAEVDQEAIDLARTYRAFLVTLGTAIRESGFTANGNGIGNYETDEYGTYSIEKNRTIHKSKTVRGYTLDGTAIFNTSKLTIKLFKEETSELVLEVLDTNGTQVYAYKDDETGSLKEAFDAAQNGYTIKVYQDVTLDENVTIAENTEITLTGAEHVTFNAAIALNKGSKLTADKQIALSTFTNPEYSEVVEEASGENYVYYLKALDPKVTGASAGTQGFVLGAKIDESNGDDKLIVLDILDPESITNARKAGNGITAAQFRVAVSFAMENADPSLSTVELEANAETGLVATGTKVTVTARNSFSAVEDVAVYTVIILGDTNCNGMVEAGDDTLIDQHYTQQKELTGYALLAANVNQDSDERLNNGSVDSGDASKNEVKFNTPDKYKTALN